MAQESSHDDYYGAVLHYSGAGKPKPTEKTRHEWAKHYFPQQFTRPFAKYQEEFWEWGWKIEKDEKYRPRVECEARGVGKSTNAEALCVALIAREKRNMIGYVSLEEEKAGKHFDSIKALLETPALLRDYPHCHPKVQTLRNAAERWSRDAIITESNAMIVPLSLQGSSRGWKSPISARFDFFVLDDIDKLGQSVQFVRKLLELLKGEIIAAGTDKTGILFAQNLVYRDSICSMVFDHRADILSDRIFCGPYPLLVDYEAEKRDIEGDANNAKRWTITSGKAYDPAISIEYAESLLNQFGKSTFDRECQQDVHKVEDDKDFREWNEVYHVITYSEFIDFFTSHKVDVWNVSHRHPFIPSNWNVGLGLDWGSTLGHPTAVVGVARPPEGVPLNNSFFAFLELCLPKFPHLAGEDPELVSPGRVAQALKTALRKWNVHDRQIRQHLMSHEATAALNTMRIDLADELKTFFNKWKPKRGSGVPQVQNMLEIDYAFPHPFREELQGRPRLYFVVPDEQGELVFGDLGKLTVAQPTDADGFARARYEIPLYSHLNSGQNKIDDDFCFVAGTLITTLKGDVPIESVIPDNDYVWTRQGWKRVLSAEMTNANADTYTLNTNSGRSLTGTGNHPIFTENGVVPLSRLNKNEKIYVCDETPCARWMSLCFKVLNFIGTYHPILGTGEVVSSVTRDAETHSIAGKPVYNLAVAECPEYLANGILVHNCDSLLGLANVFMVTSDTMGNAERRELSLPETIQKFAVEEMLAKGAIEQAERVMVARAMAFGEMDKEQEEARIVLSKYRPARPKVVSRRFR